MKLVLFDCDGTLVDTAHNIHECMRRTFIEAGLPEPDIAQTKDVIGLSLDHAIAQVLNRAVDDEMANMAARYKEHFTTMRQESWYSEPLFEGIDEMLGKIAARDDILLGIVTGKSRRGVKHILERYGYENLFYAIRTADDCPSKPHPAMVLECCEQSGIEPYNALVIGDSIYDMQMAIAAGARAIGVGWGYHQQSQLVDAGAHEIADNASHLETLI